jgi:hypothetical protein
LPAPNAVLSRKKTLNALNAALSFQSSDLTADLLLNNLSRKRMDKYRKQPTFLAIVSAGFTAMVWAFLAKPAD